MNREDNLLRVIDSWLATDCGRIIIVDWSCDTPLINTLSSSNISDTRIRLIRVHGEEKWILTHAYNVGLSECSSDFILKLDNDHRISESFFRDNYIGGNTEALLGSWRMARDPSQVYINGAFYIRTETLRKIGCFNEFITTYGWDDTYLHESLFASGAGIGLIKPHTIEHIEQTHESRTRNQNISLENELANSVGVKTTDFMNRRNMYLTNVLPRQGGNSLKSSYSIKSDHQGDAFDYKVIQRESSPIAHLDASYQDLAVLLAYRDFYCWAKGVLPTEIGLSDACRLHPLLPTFSSPKHTPQSGTPTAAARRDKNKASIRAAFHNGFTANQRQIINNKLKYILPGICHYYGHTNNDYSYVVNLHALGIGKEEAQEINLIIPEWVREKVKCDSILTCDDNPKKRIVKPITSFRSLAQILLLDGSNNQYFWAAYNAFSPYLKRSLYDLIESSGAPSSILLGGILDGFLHGQLSEDFAHSALDALAFITPLEDTSKFTQSIAHRIEALSPRFSSSAISRCYSLAREAASWHNSDYVLTLVTSLFKGSEHLTEYCLNIRRMHLFAKTSIDIHLIPSQEANAQLELLNSYFSNCSNVRIHRHAEDPGLYECWNNSAKSAISEYIGNANVDDRRGRYHSDYLIFKSKLNHIDAISSALLIDSSASHMRYSKTQDIWFTGMGGDRCTDNFISVTNSTVESRNHMHCMPIWRRDIHGSIGYFNEPDYGTSADWEFWLRAARAKKKLSVVDLPLGFYLIDTGSHNRRKAHERMEKERKILSEYYPGVQDSKTLILT